MYFKDNRDGFDMPAKIKLETILKRKVRIQMSKARYKKRSPEGLLAYTNITYGEFMPWPQRH